MRALSGELTRGAAIRSRTLNLPAHTSLNDGVVTAVGLSATHGPGKPNRPSVRLIEGLGVDGDAHAGQTVQHRSRVARDPQQPNLRQVHLIHGELQDELRVGGFAVSPGQMGEYITTRGIELLALPAAARLHLGETAVVEVTGLRNPCRQFDQIRAGLMAATVDHAANGALIRKAGIMGIVVTSGEVRPGDPIQVELPLTLHQPLRPV